MDAIKGSELVLTVGFLVAGTGAGSAKLLGLVPKKRRKFVKIERLGANLINYRYRACQLPTNPK
jgi:hypothetical protein